VAALGFSRLLSSFLFEVPPIDPVTYALVPMLMLIGTVAAGLIPSLRAAHIEPMSALRHE
jgi:ABC-type lipoprotein release transport system permease subunit